MNHKQRQLESPIVSRFERRDLAVQFGCWLCINYYFEETINQYCANPMNSNGYPPNGFAEDLFEFWLTI